MRKKNVFPRTARKGKPKKCEPEGSLKRRASHIALCWKGTVNISGEDMELLKHLECVLRQR